MKKLNSYNFSPIQHTYIRLIDYPIDYSLYIHRVLIVCLMTLVLSCAPSHDKKVHQRNQSADSLLNLPLQTMILPLRNHEGQIVNHQLSVQAVAQFTAPVIDGIKVQACDVLIHENQLMIAYNTQGEDHHGAIQWIDISDYQNPILRYEILLPQSDVNRIRLHQNRYLIAATGESNSAARLEIFDLQDQPHWISSIDLPSYQANMLMLYAHYALVSSGDDGGISIINIQDPLHPQWQGFRPIADLRYVEALSSRELLLVTGGTHAMVSRQSWPQGFENSSSTMSNTTHEISSDRDQRNILGTRDHVLPRIDYILNDMTLGAPTWGFREQDIFYLSADQHGVLSFQLRNDEILLQSQVETEGDANAVVKSDFGYALLANGQEGLVVMDLSPNLPHEILAHFDVPGDRGSANAIVLQDNKIMLADGLGGVKFLQSNLEEQEEQEETDQNQGISSNRN
jgi:hypothetical protein